VPAAWTAGEVPAAWTAGPVIDRGPVTVVDLIQAQASATPAAPAVRTADAELSYRQLDERSNQIAHHLLARGVRDEVLVGVCLGRTADLVPALLGVWKAGGGYLPLDPGLPPRRLRHMTDAAGCPLVITSTEHIAALTAQRPAAGSAFVLTDADQDAIAAQPVTPAAVRIHPAQLAYVMFTSGSTGMPKGALIQHEGLANYLLWTVDAYASRRVGGAPVFSSISFDLGIPNIFTPLLVGQATYLLPDAADVADLGPLLAAAAPYSFIKMTPGHLDLLSYQLSAGQIRDLAGLVIAAGDSFPVTLAARWLELAGPGGTQVATEYGPTEITIGNSGQPVASDHGTVLVPLGAPIPNTTMYVLNDRLEPVPPGQIGEVYIGGVGVARGYLGRPDLTADRFLPDPYGPAGSRLYRSRDLARWRPDGTPEFAGRVDNQVKIRGYRVELGDIEANLRRHPDVRDAVVAAREPAPDDKRLVAYVVLAAGQSLDGAALRAHLAAALPGYMIPEAFIAIDGIPLTDNGKLDSRALPLLL
jgi:amino acid adenylation domain-containing protein